MSVYRQDLVSQVTRTNPSKPPRSERFRYKQTLDYEWRLMYQRDPAHAIEWLRREAAQSLADAIIDWCAFFHKDCIDLAGPDPSVLIELTVDDRGRYEQMIPNERAEAARIATQATTKRLTESLPYGLADAAREFYE